MPILFADQSRAIEKLRRFKVGALFMEPGTGKTRAAYELINSVEGIEYVLYLAPCQAIRCANEDEGVVAEIERCGGFRMDHDFVGIETLSSSDRVYLSLVNKLEGRRSFIVVDESLKIKNWEAKRTKRIIHLGTLTEYKLVLNGTPLSRNVMDLWAQFEFLSPKILGMGLAQYKNTFVKYSVYTKRINGFSVSREVVDGYENIDYLYSLIKHYVYECDLKLDVRQRFFERGYCVDEETRAEYLELKAFMLSRENLLFRNNNIFLEMIQKMQHSYCCTEGKFDVLDVILQNEGVANSAVFCKFIKSRNEVQRRYPDVRVLTFGKDSYALNLQQYSCMVFFDKTFDYALRLQAMRRTYRKGQMKDCRYYDLTGDVGLEQMIERNIMKKVSMLDYFKKVSFKTFMEEL